MVGIKYTGTFKHAEKFLLKLSNFSCVHVLKKYGDKGVKALASATPVDTGLTASSWGYEIVKDGDTYTIYWTNSNIQNGVQIAVILQTGHGTGGGGYVEGIDYINPALKSVFENIAESAWKEVTST